MKTSVIELRDMLSVLSVSGVEERIGKVPGVESATVNFDAGTATVRYDETRLDAEDIRSDVRQSGYEHDSSAGAPVTNAAPVPPSKPAPSVSTDASKPTAPKSSTPTGAAMAPASGAPAHGGQHDEAAPSKS